MIFISILKVRNFQLINIAIVAVMLILLIITYIGIHGEIVSYSGGKEFTNLKTLDIYNDKNVLSGSKYLVTLTTGNTYEAYDSIYDSDYKLVLGTRIVRDSGLGFKLYKDGNLMVLEYTTSSSSNNSSTSTSKMSNSEKKSLKH
jgi:hypothetical protein